MSWPAIPVELQLEYKFSNPPDIRGYKPNVDVAILYPGGSETPFIGIESKFVEPYRDKPKTLKPAYLRSAVWDRFEMPNLRRLAQSLDGSDKAIKRPFVYLDAAQLLRHLVAMCHDTNGKNFKLGYFWYEVPVVAGETHRSEIEQFRAVADDDEVEFFECSY